MTDTTFLLLTGPDRPALEADRRTFLSSYDHLTPERVDLVEQGPRRLLEALSSGGLFASQRLVDVTGGDQINAETARALAQAAAGSDAAVVIRGGDAKPHPAVVKALKAVADCRHFALPAARELPGRIRQMAADRDVTLDAGSVTVLVERSGHDLDRIDALLRMLAQADLRNPQARQVELLLGSSAAPGVPWQVTDAIERADAAAALELLAGVDAQALLAFLARRVGELGRVAEAGAASADQAAAVLGGPPWRAKSALGPARALGTDGACVAIAAVVEATSAARGEVSAAQVDDLVGALVVRLAGLFAR